MMPLFKDMEEKGTTPKWVEQCKATEEALAGITPKKKQKTT